MDARHRVDELHDLHGSFADEGFTVFKTKLGGKSPKEKADRVATIRETIGPEADLFVDANQAWTVKEAITTVDVISEYGISWVEEPISEFAL